MLPWIVALKVYNAGSPSWCIPRKGTAGHATVDRIRKGEKAKTMKEVRDELEKKTRAKPKTEKKSMSISLNKKV